MKTKSISKKTSLLCLIGFCILFIEGSPIISKEKYSQKEGLSKSSLNNTIDHTMINAGNIAMWVWADGRMATAPDGNAGAFYPRGTANIIFADGIIWGGIVRDGLEPLIRVGGQQYNAGTQPGKIISKGVVENSNDPNVNRIWRIRRDLSDHLLQKDVAALTGKPQSEVTYEEVKELRDHYIKDWREWPWQKGAPFYDADGDGVYSPYIDDYGSHFSFPNHDEPGLADADQVVWFVCNDLDTALANNFMGSPPIGLEVQVTLWGYRRHDAMDNCIFKQVRVIYKGTNSTPNDARIDSMYLAQWSDPDLGGLGDDLVGCDTLLNLGFVYNASFSDIEFEKYNLSPPAAGYNILAGPMVPNSYSEAIFGLKRIPNFRNLRMSTFIHFPYSMNYPDNGRIYSATLQWWNILRGFRHAPISPLEPFYNPLTGIPTKFRVSGDPVSGIGWLDESAGERKMILSSGPFNLSLGDTNEITIALVAGLGGDRLLSISVMKYYDRMAQAAFNNLFDLPHPPPSPRVSVSEMDGQIILNWSTSQDEVEAVEQWERSGHRFEGYNVYQLPSRYSWPKSEWLKLATYDLKNDVTSIIQEEFDRAAGAIVTRAVQIGTNSGIVRSLIIKDDKINNYPLINGKEYYFAVSCYSYNPDRSDPLKSMESEAMIVTVVPKSLKLGERLQATIGDTIFAEHTAGFSDGKVFAIVTDPTALTGHDYHVEFYRDNSGQLLWRLINFTLGETLLWDQTNQSGDENYLITEGVQVIVEDVVPGAKDEGYLYYPPEHRWVTRESDLTGAGPNWLLEGWAGLVGWGANFYGSSVPASGLRNIQIRFAATDDAGNILDPNDPKVSMGYRYLRRANNPSPKPEFNEFIVNPQSGFPYQDFRPMPLAAFDMETDPPRRLAVAFQENNTATGKVDGKWFPGRYDTEGGINATREFLYIFASDYSGTPKEPYISANMLDDASKIDLMYVCVFSRFGSRVPQAGDYIVVNANHVTSAGDVFSFKTAAPDFSIEAARQNIQQINVYPNPYYGIFSDVSSAEQYVTFSHLPQQTVIRIFTLAGVLVKTIIKDDQSSLLRWYLNNEKGRLVGNGIYIVYIDLPELDLNKILKLVVVHK